MGKRKQTIFKKRWFDITRHNALNKSTLIFKCPCIVVWFGNLPPPFILPPPFGILNGGGRILNGGVD